VALLAPGVEFQEPPCLLLRCSKFPAPLVVPGQLGQRTEHAAVQSLALEQRPLLEGRAVAHEELIEHAATVQVNRLVQPPRAGGTRFGMAMGMLITAGQEIAESCDVEVMVAGSIPLDRVGRDAQHRHTGGAVANRLAQVGQRLVQAQVRRTLGPLGPQQPGQRSAPVRPIGFERQVRQQRPHFVRFERRDRRAIQRDVQRAEQRKRQMGHQEPSDP
jgi:hypothetical protein